MHYAFTENQQCFFLLNYLKIDHKPETQLLHIVFDCLPQLVIITQDVHCATNEWQCGTPGAVSCRSQIMMVTTRAENEPS